MQEESFIYQLEKVLPYSKKEGRGFEPAETGTLEFQAPSMAVFDESAKLTQLISKAAKQAAADSIAMFSPEQLAQLKKDQEEKGASDEVPKASEIQQMLYSSDVDLGKVRKAFIAIAIKTGYLDENTKLLKDHLDELGQQGFMDLLCKYVEVFIGPSVFRGDEPGLNGLS